MEGGEKQTHPLHEDGSAELLMDLYLLNLPVLEFYILCTMSSVARYK